MSGIVRLDRMVIEEAGPDPVAIAAAIHAQLDHRFWHVPVERIAADLDIVEIRKAPLKGLAGALIMPPDRNNGSILVADNTNNARRAFTIAHELGHYLSLHHRPLRPGIGFTCTPHDLAVHDRMTRDNLLRQHWQQEDEANRFAIELLAPPHLVRPYVDGAPHLQRVLDIAAEFGLSKEAAARRYRELHPGPLALVFAQGRSVRYIERHRAFPQMDVFGGSALPGVVNTEEPQGLSTAREITAMDFGIVVQRPKPVFMQTLYQMSGYSITLLTFDPGVFDTPAFVDNGCPI